MNFIKTYLGDLFLTTRFYLAGAVAALLFIIAFLVPVILPFVTLVFLGLLVLMLADYVILFAIANSPRATRQLASRLSNGDKNEIVLRIRNRSRLGITVMVIDELPVQLQERKFKMQQHLSGGQQRSVAYSIIPTERGEYLFGNIILFAQTGLGLISRRFTISASRTVNVYPSFIQLRNYQLISRTATSNEPGSQRKRKIGQSMEFEQVKDYVSGDDIRTINWKATARRGGLMVNNYVDEKSQQVYCVIDKGRLMKMPFKGLSLLDYAINAVLALSSVCLQRQDRVGLLSFSNKLTTLLPAERKPVQRENILQALYKEQTDFLESDYEMLYTQVRQKIKQRSLVMLFTNFESLSGLRRQMPYLRSIARHHLLLVVFFENTELKQLSFEKAISLEDVYVRTIAEKFVFEKKMLVKELQQHGILSVLTTPENLTLNSINKYLELKSRQAW